jgi:ribosomal protein S18 acetylase RimI-like enzyme
MSGNIHCNNPIASLLRPAVQADLSALAQLEQECFETDRITHRQWRYLLTQARAALWVEAYNERLLGYVLVLYRDTSSIARIYSIAVTEQARRLGVGRRLVQLAEHLAKEQGRTRLRLEIRRDNVASIGLFERLGYQYIGYRNDYYEDNMDAVRYEKRLSSTLMPRRTDPNARLQRYKHRED